MTKPNRVEFNIQPESAFTNPLFLQCRTMNVNPQTKKPADTVIGRGQSKHKRLRKGMVYQMWVMYGKDESGNYSLYFKQENDDEIFRLIKGKLQFVFEAEKFAQIAIYAGRQTLKYFMIHSVIENQEELLKFFKLVKDDISSIRREVIHALLCDMTIRC